jgi:uncharacterized coiled-coil protein SlyX
MLVALAAQNDALAAKTAAQERRIAALENQVAERRTAALALTRAIGGLIGGIFA